MTTLQPNEIVTEVRVPSPGRRAAGTYLKLERKVGDYATVAVAVHVSFADDDTVERAGIALTGVGPTNLRARRAEDALQRARARRRGDRRGGAARGRGGAAVRRHPRHGRLQAEHGAGLHRARAAQGARPGRRLRSEPGCGGGAQDDAPGHGHRQRDAAVGRGGAAAPARALPARDAVPHGDAHRLRHDELRRVHRPRRRHAREVVHVPGRSGRRPRGHDRRGPRRPRRAARAPGGLQGGARPAVRVLHAGDDARRPRRCSRRTPTRAPRRSAGRSPGTSAAAPATRTSSRPCSGRRASRPREVRDGDAEAHETRWLGRSVKRARGRPLHRRPRQLHRRHQAARDAAHGDPAQPDRPRDDQLDRHVEGVRAPGRRRRRHGRAPGAAQPRLDADALRRHAGRARDRQGADAGPGGRLRDRRGLVHGARRARADRGRLRAAPRGHDAAGRARTRRAADPRRQGGADRQQRLPLGGRRRRRHRARVRGGGPRRQPRDALPALAPGAARVLRLRRGRQPGDRQDDDLHDLAGAARPPDGVRPRGRARRAPDPDHLARHRRRLRQQGARLPGLRRRHRRLAPHRPPGQVDRGPHREPDLDRVRARLPHAGRARAHGRGEDDRRSASTCCPTRATPSRTRSRRSSRPGCSTSSPARTTSRRPT